MQSACAAIELARRGLQVFRLARGTKSNFIDTDWAKGGATLDLFEVLEKFGGSEYNIGVLAEGLLILDVDAAKGGFASLEGLGELPETFTVETKSGGRHFYFKPPPGVEYGNTIEKLGPGLDTRGNGGYVVGPGSAGYKVICAADIAPLPPVLAARLAIAPHKAAEGQNIAGPLDTPDAIAAAGRYLKSALAGAAVEGQGGDGQTYRTACRVLDYGVSPETALDLMLEHYNPRCSPPWEIEDLERKVQSAAQYRQSEIGRDNPSAGFTPVVEAPRVNVFGSRVRKFEMTAETIKDIPVRPWLARQRLIKGKLSSLVAPGSIGKSLLTLQWACAVALGPDHEKSNFCGLEVVEQCNVLVVNNEDEHDELDRRLAAVVSHFGLPWETLRHRIHLYSGQNDPTFLIATRTGKGQLSETEFVADAIAYMKEHNIGLFIADPLVDTHEAEENSNTEMAKVMRVWKRIALEANAAGLLVHHSRKTQSSSSDGHAGNADAGRGAGATVNAARLNFTFFNMSEKDAEALGVAAEVKHRYVRLDDSKINYGLASPQAEWFYRCSVLLPNGESLGVLEPVKLTPVSANDGATIAAVLAPFVLAGGPVRLKTAVNHLCADPIFSGETPSAMTRRTLAAFDRGRDYQTDHGRLIFTADGKAGGVFEIRRT